MSNPPSSPSKRNKLTSSTPALDPTAPSYHLGDLDADLHGSHVRSILTTPSSAFPPTSAAVAIAESLQVKRLVSAARLPTRGSPFAAGYDLYASQAALVPARGMCLVATGVAMAVPMGTYGRVAPRSGLAVKHGITTGAGVIDYDYRGEVKVVLFNLGDADFAVQVGDRVAQLVLERIVTPEVQEVLGELEGTERGAGGFGSTGGFGFGVGERVLVVNGGVKRKGNDDETMDISA